MLDQHFANTAQAPCVYDESLFKRVCVCTHPRVPITLLTTTATHQCINGIGFNGDTEAMLRKLNSLTTYIYDVIFMLIITLIHIYSMYTYNWPTNIIEMENTKSVLNHCQIHSLCLFSSGFLQSFANMFSTIAGNYSTAASDCGNFSTKHINYVFILFGS